jgi:LemA protein
VQEYNTTVRRFPVNLTAKIFGYDTKANFTVEDEAEISEPPPVDFSRPDTTRAPAPEPANP